MQLLRNLSISRKLYGTFLFCTAITAVIALFALYQLSRVEAASAQVRDNWLPSVAYIGVISDQVAGYRLLEFNHILSPDDRAMQQAESQMETLQSGLRRTFRQLAASQSDGLEAGLNRRFEDLLGQYQGLSESILTLSAAGQDSLAFVQINGQSRTVYNQMNEVLGRLREFNREGGVKASEASSRVYTVATRSLAGLLAVSLVVTGLLTGAMIRSIIKPVAGLNHTLQALAGGDVTVQVPATTTDEMGQLAGAAGKLIATLERSARFAREIGNGQFDDAFRPISDKDVLGAALVGMRDKLRQTAQEDYRRNWATTGYARLSEMLRSNYQEPQHLYDAVVSFTVKYVGASQSGLFLLHEVPDGRGSLKLAACYAYDRKKFLERTIEVGVGLVGQAVLERESIYMTKLPPQYLEITSGLGNTAPVCLLVLPLLSNDTVYGVLEVACLEVLAPYQLEFLEKAGESIAAALASLKVAVDTQRLLETAQQQTEQLRAQEEEMRQNLEELAATQEELQRKERSYVERIEELQQAAQREQA